MFLYFFLTDSLGFFFVHWGIWSKLLHHFFFVCQNIFLCYLSFSLFLCLPQYTNNWSLNFVFESLLFPPSLNLLVIWSYDCWMANVKYAITCAFLWDFLLSYLGRQTTKCLFQTTANDSLNPPCHLNIFHKVLHILAILIYLYLGKGVFHWCRFYCLL